MIRKPPQEPANYLRLLTDQFLNNLVIKSTELQN